MPALSVIIVGIIGLLLIAARFFIADAKDPESSEAEGIYWGKNMLTFFGFVFFLAAWLKNMRDNVR
jgi:hypothetical protein